MRAALVALLWMACIALGAGAIWAFDTINTLERLLTLKDERFATCRERINILSTRLNTTTDGVPVGAGITAFPPGWRCGERPDYEVTDSFNLKPTGRLHWECRK